MYHIITTVVPPLIRLVMYYIVIMQHPPGHLLHLSCHSISLTRLVMYCFKLCSVGYEIICQPDMIPYCCVPLTRLVIYCTRHCAISIIITKLFCLVILIMGMIIVVIIL